jgi:hypothetical protein
VPARKPTVSCLLAATCLALLPGCRVTFRQPEIRPLNPTRQYSVPAAALCDAVTRALTGLELDVTEVSREEGACLLETAYRRLGESGERHESLRDVAYVTGADYFGHGRFLVTATVRTATSATRIRLTTRIEGFDAGYRSLRSSGVIEQELFDRIALEAGAEPIDGQTTS